MCFFQQRAATAALLTALAAATAFHAQVLVLAGHEDHRELELQLPRGKAAAASEGPGQLRGRVKALPDP